jgi:desulfoferrodoxin (superoxide reductase-like protein)
LHLSLFPNFCLDLYYILEHNGASIMKEEIKITTNNGVEHNMSKDTFIKWLCLLEIVQLAEEKALDLKMDLEKIDWVKPLAFKKYIGERFKSMEVDVEAESESRTKFQKISINNSHHIPEYH